MNVETIPSCFFGSLVDGIPILEETRATVWEESRTGASELEDYMISNYLSKGVRAVLARVHHAGREDYAVFVELGFLRAVEPE